MVYNIVIITLGKYSDDCLKCVKFMLKIIQNKLKVHDITTNSLYQYP